MRSAFVVHGGLARFFACRDEKPDWHEITEYTVYDAEDIKLATWLMQDHEKLKAMEDSE